MSYGIVYLLTSPSGKRYVGQTITPLEERWQAHCRPNSYCIALGRAIFKYGPNSFEKDTIAECSDKAELDRLERYWIILLKSTDPKYGYNIREGGSHGKLSKETRLKLSQTFTGLRAGEKHPFYGKHLSKEHREKLSVTFKEQRIHSGDNNPFYGRKHSEETRHKMKEAQLLRWAARKEKIKEESACLA